MCWQSRWVTGKTDWIKNVLAANEANVHFTRRNMHITPTPRLCPPAPTAQTFSSCHGLRAAAVPDRGRRRRHCLSRCKPTPWRRQSCSSIVSQAHGASSYATTCSTAGNKAHTSASMSKMRGMTVRASTCPGTNRTHECTSRITASSNTGW